jgi:DDE family transposase
MRFPRWLRWSESTLMIRRQKCSNWIKGKKRHILVDTLGLLLHAVVHPADIQDRDGGGYQGPVFQKASAKILPHLLRRLIASCC